MLVECFNHANHVPVRFAVLFFGLVTEPALPAIAITFIGAMGGVNLLLLILNTEHWNVLAVKVQTFRYFIPILLGNAYEIPIASFDFV